MEGMRIGIDDRHAAQLHRSDPDAGQLARFARNGPAGHADQLADWAERPGPHQSLAQSRVADRIFRAGVDDRDHLDLADRGIGHDKLAEAAAGVDGDRLAIEFGALAPRERDGMLAEIEHDVAALEHVCAKEAGRAQRRGGQDGGVELSLFDRPGAEVIDADCAHLVGTDQALDRDRALGLEPELFGQPIGDHAAVGASVDRERERTFAIDLGHQRDAAGGIGRGGEPLVRAVIAERIGCFGRGEIMRCQRKQGRNCNNRHGDPPRPSIEGGLGGRMP